MKSSHIWVKNCFWGIIQSLQVEMWSWDIFYQHKKGSYVQSSVLFLLYFTDPSRNVIVALQQRHRCVPPLQPSPKRSLKRHVLSLKSKKNDCLFFFTCMFELSSDTFSFLLSGPNLCKVTCKNCRFVFVFSFDTNPSSRRVLEAI